MSSTPTTQSHPAQQAKKEALLQALNKTPFRVPRWLRGQHSQTLWAALARRPKGIQRSQEWLDTPDNDQLRLYSIAGDPEKPTVLLLHGLEGSAQSPYILGLQRLFAQQGWNTYALEFRTCGGEFNNAQRLYHLGETTDLDLVVRFLLERDPAMRLYLAGFSMGGNITGKWLGEKADKVPSQIKGASIVSSPFDLTISGPHIDKVFAGIYVRYFLRTLIPKALKKHKQFPGVLDAEKIRRSKTFQEFDTYATAALHGFEDAQDYWEKSSCGQFLPHIHVPTMLLTSADDPFNPPSTLPTEHAERSPFLIPQFTQRGGHVGFVAGAPWKTYNWAEHQTLRFFNLLSNAD